MVSRFTPPQHKGPLLAPDGSNGEPAPSKWSKMRQHMVATQLLTRDITDRDVLQAMADVPRHRFVPDRLQRHAYDDRPLPIGEDQTISQPYIVALTTQLARPKATDVALDVGTGSGYQAAVLSTLVERVYSVEIQYSLATEAKKRLTELDYKNITVKNTDGKLGWPENGPYNVIVAAAAPVKVPPRLIEQLAPGGRMVIPVGRWSQELVLLEKNSSGEINRSTVTAVRFVPMI